MARVTVEDCIDKVENRFDLVLLASHRARLISSGTQIAVERDNDKNPVVALREIAEKAISPEDLKEELVDSGNRFASKTGARNIKFETGDLLTMDYENRFDLILSVDVLEHIEEDREAISNISRALKPGGIFIFTTPYFDGQSTEEVFVDEHVRPGYSQGEAEQKLDEANFVLRQFTIAYGPWGNVAWKLLQKWPMSWLSGRIWLLPVVFLYYILAYPIAWVCMHLDMRSNNKTGGGILAVAVKR